MVRNRGGPSYLRAGLGRDVLRSSDGDIGWCRRRSICTASTGSRPRSFVGEISGSCLRRGLRCVRVVHGKRAFASPGREPVLKGKVQLWLLKRDEVLAFCEAPEESGRSGRAAGPAQSREAANANLDGRFVWFRRSGCERLLYRNVTKIFPSPILARGARALTIASIAPRASSTVRTTST